jgi:thiamine biosynthesis protein ThiS
MNLHINGEERTFTNPTPASPFTLAALVDSLDMKSDRVAIELNREIAPRDRWSQTTLKDGDRLEIVHFVGGGSFLERATLAPRKGLPVASIVLVNPCPPILH